MIDVARGLRRVARELLPPIVVRALRGAPAAPVGATFTGNYPSYQEAQRALGSDGYETSGYITTAVHTTRENRARSEGNPTRAADSRTVQNLAAFMTCLHGVTAETIRVLDFGGGVGLHYFTLVPFLSRFARVSWTVCELPSLARAGRESGGPEQLRFVEGLHEIEGEHFHVALASGSLQYVPAPLATWRLLAARADAVIMNRSPFVPAGADRLTAQTVHLPTPFRCPAWFFSEPVWTQAFEAAGFSRVLTWATPEDTLILDGTTVVCSGVAVRRSGPDAIR